VKQYSIGLQRETDTSSDDNALLEWLGKQVEDLGTLHNIDSKGQVQSLIVTIPTWKKIISTGHQIIEGSECDYGHRGTPTKM
jgi:hypothetical protein